MNNTFKRVLSVILCVLMACSTAAYTLAAADITYGSEYYYYLDTSDSENAKIVLDKVDEALKEQNIYEKIDLKVGFVSLGSLELDLRSINGLCKTIDSFVPILKAAKADVTGAILGDLKNVVVKNWKEDMKRGAQDITILNELIELLNDNSSLIGDFVGGNLKLGVIGKVVDVNSLLGENGVYGKVKEVLVGLVYKDKNSNEYKKALGKKLDNFVYEDVLALVNKADGALPGFTMNGNSNVDALLLSAFNSAWTKYIVPAIKGINVDWSASDNEALKKLSEILCLDGSKFDENSIKIDLSKSFESQINDILGAVIKFFFPKANWTNGGKDKIAGNFEALYKDLAAAMGVAAEPLAIVKYVLGNLSSIEGIGDYIGDYNSWTSMENAVAAVLRNTAAKTGITVTTDSKATYENILGDYLTYAVKEVVPLSYSAGAGKNVWDVLNDIANLYLIDKGFAKAFNVNVKASDSIFEKLDAILDMTEIFKGLTPAANYKSEAFIKGILDAVFSFDIAKAVDMTAITFLGDFGNRKAVEVIYNAIYVLLKNAFGKEIIVSCKDKNGNLVASPIDNAISNSSLKTTVKNVLSAIDNKKGDLLPPILFLGAICLKIEEVEANKANGIQKVAIANPKVTIADQKYSGKAIVPSAIKVNGQTMTLGKDFEYASIANNTKPGTVNVTINFIGRYTGTASASFKIAPPVTKVTGLKVSAITDTAAKLTWTKVSGASGYTVYWSTNGKKWSKKTSKKTTYTISKLKPTTKYYFKVAAYKGSFAGEYSSTVKATTKFSKVTGLKAVMTDTTAALSWKKVSGATSYTVYYSTNGKKWSKKTSKKTTYKFSKLKAYTKYYFKVVANKGKVAGVESSVVKTATKLAKVSKLSAKVTSTTATLTWKKVSGATSYTVYWSTNGKKWSKKTSKKTSYKISKLKANKTYYFKVVANKGKVAGVDSAIVKIATAPAAPTGLKASSKKGTVKLTWKKVSGAAGYEVYRNGKKIATIKKGSTATYTDKKGLKKNATYKYSVKAYKVVSKKSVLSDASKTISVKVKK